VEMGLQQKDVADCLGISQQVYSNYELGKRQPDNYMLIKLSDFFEVSVDYLLGKSGIRNPQTLEESSRLTIEELLSQQGITNPKHIASILNFIDLAAKDSEEVSDYLEKGLSVKQAN